MPDSPHIVRKKTTVKKEENHNIKLGKKGEKIARRYLKKQGWKIVEKNFKTPMGEIDIIARKGDVCAFVEVKTRLSDIFGLPSEAVTEARKAKYVAGARYYFVGKLLECTVRFDIIEVFKGYVNHIENAF